MFADAFDKQAYQVCKKMMKLVVESAGDNKLNELLFAGKEFEVKWVDV